MLKKILRDMYIEPEILAGLDETQKQTLYCKMREEQIRRWRIWDEKHELLESSVDHQPHQQTIQFLQGDDGEPWVWVMGEHKNDRTIEEILAEESKTKARHLAEIETKELRKSFVAEISDVIEYDSDCSLTITAAAAKTKPNKLPADDQQNVLAASPKIDDDMEIYCSVDELRDRINSTNNALNKVNLGTPPSSGTSTPNSQQQHPNRPTPLRTHSLRQNLYNASPRLVNFHLNAIEPSLAKPEVLREINPNRPSAKVSAKIALWEKRVIGEKTNEIYRLLQQKQQDAAQEAEEAARKREELWQEQERRAKEVEVQMRDIARRAREEHRKSISSEQDAVVRNNRSSSGSASSLDSAGGSVSQNHSSSSPPSSLDSNISRPSSQEAVIKWYRDEESHRNAGIDRLQNRPFRWFHGLMSRADAEQLLASEPTGTFLVRLSDKIWGYAISYKDFDRCKHYLVDASVPGTYQFLGANQLNHDSLNELIQFHANVPITILGKELLLRPCSPVHIVPKLLDGIID